MYCYFDYAATAPLCEEAVRAMAPFQVAGPEGLISGANANSLHGPGRKAFSAMEQSRSVVARALHARRPDEIMFTSGATEADCAAIFGMAHAMVNLRQQKGKPCGRPRVITSAIEHEAVLQPCKRLESQGFEVRYLQPDPQGFVSVSSLEECLNEDTVLVSVQVANSEVGSVQPIAELSKAAHGIGALFHTDAVQALGKIKVDLQSLGVDAASFSAHKVGGPKGVGALYLKARTPFEPFMLGGGQETGRRSGTQNVCGMVGFAAACKASVEKQPTEEKRLRCLRQKLYEGLAAQRDVRVTGEVQADDMRYLPNIVHVMVKGLESESLILRLDKLGFAVSGGSACASGSLDPSHVLSAMGVPADLARGALRLSLGRYSSGAEVDALLEAIPRVLHW